MTLFNKGKNVYLLRPSFAIPTSLSYRNMCACDRGPHTRNNYGIIALIPDGKIILKIRIDNNHQDSGYHTKIIMA